MSKLDVYVPRHVRYGCCVKELPKIEVKHEISEVIPILDADGKRVHSFSQLVSLSAIDAMAKYSLEDFRLRSLIEAGVKLDVVNLLPSNSRFLDTLSNIMKHANSALDVVDRLEKLDAEKSALLDGVVSAGAVSNNSNVELSNN